MINKIVRKIVKGFSTTFGTLLFKAHIKLSGQKIGGNPKVDGLIYWKISPLGKVVIGKNFRLNSRRASNLVGITNRASFQVIGSGSITIGDNCGFTSTVLSSRSEINIGNNVLIGANVRILDHDYHSLNAEKRRIKELDVKNVKTKTVNIGDDVFIGTNAIILKGVSIGARSIIGAGAVVSGLNIPEDSLVMGNPAKIIVR